MVASFDRLYVYTSLSLAEGEAIAVKEELEKLIKKNLKAPVKLMELFFKWVFRPPKLLGQVFLSKSAEDGNYMTGDISIKGSVRMGYILMTRGGRFYRKNNDSNNLYTTAKGFLKLALRRDSNYRFAHANLGNIERLLGNINRAVYHYERAIELDPKYVNGYSELSWVYLQYNQLLFWPETTKSLFHHSTKIHWHLVRWRLKIEHCPNCNPY